ncbi:alpha/beta hydrolase [Pseudonocardia xishanensis]|uniref:Alpha/beta fold hydrolase n=1 Tax=Pseudonocardia xishanensis TaxID=630995 RepID=A0ABP8RTC1_9PSEU
MPFAAVNGQRLWFEDSGGVSPVILMAHAFGMSSSSFDAQVELLQSEFRCVRWDARGFGRTEFDGGPFDFWDQAADGVALLAHLGIESAVWMGLSQGGFIALRAALHRPDRVTGLVLVDTMAGVDGERSLRAKRDLLGSWVTHGLDADRLATFLKVTFGEVDHAPPKIVASMHEIDRAGLGRALDCLLDRDDIQGRLRHVDAPALVVHGECDRSIALERAEAMRADLSGAEPVVVIPSAGHAACVTHPDLVAPHVARFVRAQQCDETLIGP